MKKKKKKGGRINASMHTPGLSSTLLGKSLPGRMSPSMMKVESVKSFSSAKKVGPGSLKKVTASPRPTGMLTGMVLKSNIAMAAELPKSLPKTKKTTSVEKGSNLKKKTLTGAAKATKGKKGAKNLTVKDDMVIEKVQTLDELLTPPDRELVEAYATPRIEARRVTAEPPEERKGEVPVSGITLIAVKPLSKKASQEIQP